MRPEATQQLSIFLSCFALFPLPFVSNRFPASSEQRQCSNDVSPSKAGACHTSRLPNRPEITGVPHHNRKQRNTTFPERELPDGSGELGPPDVSRGTPRRGAHAAPLSLRPHLPFPHSGGPGRRKPGHGKGWCGRPGGLRAGLTRICAELHIQSPPLECTKLLGSL